MNGGNSNRLGIYSALVANLLIAIMKFVAGGVTNSASMISEGIHSLVDTTNQLLLLYGLNRSMKPADLHHPFGYGRELYFWSFIVAILIFGLGGGVSVYQGILHILHPEKLSNPLWNYGVLSLSILFEGISLYIAAKAFNKVRGKMRVWEAIIKSRDPVSFLVLAEDAAAVGGLLLVLFFMIINHVFDIPVLDGVASICVGLLLIFVSFILARESRSLLMGEGLDADVKEKIKMLAEENPKVGEVTKIISNYQSPEQVVLMLLIDFKDDLTTEDITNAITSIRQKIKSEFQLVQYILIQPV
jgi:cation diffusion facilitator family transporter